MAKVFYASARALKWSYSDSMPGKLVRLLGMAGIGGRFEEGEWVAIKTHFGSSGAHRIVRPIFIRKVVDSLKAAGLAPFVTDTVRLKGMKYLDVANANGINPLTVDAPVLLADGLYGNDNLIVKAGEILGEIAMASLIHDVPAMVVLSHIKGHINAGYAGAIKNLAMGAVSATHRTSGWKCGRGGMHSIGDGGLGWDAQSCELCYQCVEVCPLECIKFEDQGTRFTYADEKCWRCGRCARVCPADSITHSGRDVVAFQRSMAEAAGTVLGTFATGKVLFVNFLTEIQPECDCMPGADVPVLQDQGILVSDDIVAVEEASIRMLRAAEPLPQSAASDNNLAPGDDVLLGLNAVPYEEQVIHAEHLGLGSREYELIEL